MTIFYRTILIFYPEEADSAIQAFWIKSADSTMLIFADVEPLSPDWPHISPSSSPHAFIMNDWRSSVAREIGLFRETGTQYRLRFRHNLLNEI
jgi:hypothetical protein